MLCGWEGNRRSGVALAMRHGLSGLSTYGLKSLSGDEHPPMPPAGYGTFTFTLPFVYIVFKLVTHWRRRGWCAAHIKNKPFTDNTVFILWSTFCNLVFVNFLINSTFAFDVVNFTLRHEWHYIFSWYSLLIFLVTPYNKNGDNQCCIISIAAN